MNDQLKSINQQNDNQSKTSNVAPSNKVQDLNRPENNESEFAFGFPEWSLTPPNQVIKRIRR